MAAPIEYLSAEDESVCLRCHDTKAVLITRKEKFCTKCFARFVRSKQRKLMPDDKYKVKYGPRAEDALPKVLVTVSLGSSSLVMLDVMISLLQEQAEMHKGKQGFEIVVLNIDQSKTMLLEKHAKSIMPHLEQFWPVKFTHKCLSVDSYIIDQELLQRITLYPDFTAMASNTNLSSEITLTELLKRCPNKSSAEDLLTIVYDELILRTAHVEKCETILYGHNMTRIANEIIALTVKGRGSSIHEKISDRTTVYRSNDYKIIYPLRDVLQAEVDAYAKLMNLDQFIVRSTIPQSKINRNMTIRELTTQYFNMLDATGYASTASTVVKTGDKLGPPKFQEVSQTCQVCGIEIHQNPIHWLRRITVNEAAPIETEEELEYVKLYQDLVGKNETTDETNGELKPLQICYGCTVTLGGIKATEGFVWPVKGNEQQENAEILNEYILTDDEE